MIWLAFNLMMFAARVFCYLVVLLFLLCLLPLVPFLSVTVRLWLKSDSFQYHYLNSVVMHDGTLTLHSQTNDE